MSQRTVGHTTPTADRGREGIVRLACCWILLAIVVRSWAGAQPPSEATAPFPDEAASEERIFRLAFVHCPEREACEAALAAIRSGEIGGKESGSQYFQYQWLMLSTERK